MTTTPSPQTPAPESPEERRRGELRTGVVYPILVLIVGMFITSLWGVVDMHSQVKALAKDNADLKAEIEQVKKSAAADRAARAAERKELDDKAETRNEKLNDRIGGVERSLAELTATLKGIQSGIVDMKDDMRDMRKKLDRLERKG